MPEKRFLASTLKVKNLEKIYKSDGRKKISCFGSARFPATKGRIHHVTQYTVHF